jgi:hypothetical protein
MAGRHRYHGSLAAQQGPVVFRAMIVGNIAAIAIADPGQSNSLR